MINGIEQRRSNSLVRQDTEYFEAETEDIIDNYNNDDMYDEHPKSLKNDMLLQQQQQQQQSSNYEEPDNYYTNDDDYFNEEDEYKYLQEEEEEDDELIKTHTLDDNNHTSNSNRIHQLAAQDSIDDSEYNFGEKSYFGKQESILEEDENEIIKSPDIRNDTTISGGAGGIDQTSGLNKIDEIKKDNQINVSGEVEKKPDVPLALKKSGATAKDRWHWAYNKIMLNLNVSFIDKITLEYKLKLFVLNRVE